MVAHNWVKFVNRDMVEGMGPSMDVPCISLQQFNMFVDKNEICMKFLKSGENMQNKWKGMQHLQPVKLGPIPNKIWYLPWKCIPI